MPLENFGQYTMEMAYQNIVGAAPDGTPAVPQGWADVKAGIEAALADCQRKLAAFEQGADDSRWLGATHDAAVRNLSTSFDTARTLSTAADTLHKLTDTFSNTIKSTRAAIVPNYAIYQADIKNDPDNRDVYDYAFNRYAQSVMTTTYAPNIAQISSTPRNFPAAPPEVSHAAAPPAPPTNTGGTPALAGGGGAPRLGGGGAPNLGPADVPAMPNVADLASAPTPPEALAAPQVPTDTTAMASPPSETSGLDGLSGLGQSLASPLQSALGQGMGAAQQAGNKGGLGGLKGAGKLPPEGALAKGLKGGAGAGGGGAGLRGALSGKPAGAPSAAAGDASARTVAAGSRAGLSGAAGAGAMGAPGAGAPGAGHQGAPGGAHQPNKALRRKKNGEDLIGDAEAVVPVLGEHTRADAAKSEAT